jgi:hypothetical protein
MDSCPHNKLGNNKSSVNEKQCLSCRSKTREKELDIDEYDDIRRTSSSTDDEEVEMLKNTRLVSEDDEDSDNEEGRMRKLTKKAMNNSNDSFPDDESEVDRFEVEQEDEEVHEKSFEQEDTIVYFHREPESVLHRVVTPTTQVS